MAVAVAVGFEPTYEGWKLSSGPLSPTRAYGFEPTYEGWKLCHNATCHLLHR